MKSVTKVDSGASEDTKKRFAAQIGKAAGSESDCPFGAKAVRLSLCLSRIGKKACAVGSSRPRRLDWLFFALQCDIRSYVSSARRSAEHGAFRLISVAKAAGGACVFPMSLKVPKTAHLSEIRDTVSPEK